MRTGTIAEDLVRWYDAVRRDLPWRVDSDPYKIWVSEVMLQQTRVEAAIPYFERFMDRFPTLDSLAAADGDEVDKLWEGLGYYSRARNLHSAVREVCERYGGTVPASYDDFRSLPGVGDYTAGAVLSIAYNQPLPAVDGNVLRVIARLFAIPDDIMLQKTRKAVVGIVSGLLPALRASAFNQALMELGALLCAPKSPRCGECPVAHHCAARQRGLQTSLPVRARKSAPKDIHLTAVLVQAADGSILVRRRPARGLLAGLWEIPNWETPERRSVDAETAVLPDAGPQAPPDVEPLRGRRLEEMRCLGQYTHAFSHRRWIMSVYHAQVDARFPCTEPYRWVDRPERTMYTFGQVFNKIFGEHLAQ
ncbi:MAG: A/G-specific adenine glycosylase [Bacilli bacterium]